MNDSRRLVMVRLKYISILLGCILSCFSLQLSAKTPDGETPSEELVCSDYEGAAFGLCNAYCEAMDCHLGPGAKASQRACMQVRENFKKKTGEDIFPCEQQAECPCAEQVQAVLDQTTPLGGTFGENELACTSDKLDVTYDIQSEAFNIIEIVRENGDSEEKRYSCFVSQFNFDTGGEDVLFDDELTKQEYEQCITQFAQEVGNLFEPPNDCDAPLIGL